MAKRPTPKKRREKSRGRRQYAMYVYKQVRRLKNRLNSPYSRKPEVTGAGDSALDEITRIKA